MRTIITHFYNEEYLLPWWLDHHKKYFDNGILINYHSTDRSVEICKDICPNWYVVDTHNGDFNPLHNDKEIEFYERHVSGWKLSLTVTEFLVGNINHYLDQNLKEPEDITDINIREYNIPVHMFNEWNPNGNLEVNRHLWDQCKLGIKNAVEQPLEVSWWGRTLHNHKFKNYLPGRHCFNINTQDLAIFKYANAIVSPQMLDRRLQIQHRIPNSHKSTLTGWQHYASSLIDTSGQLTDQSLYDQINHFNQITEDCTDLIKDLISKM